MPHGCDRPSKANDIECQRIRKPENHAGSGSKNSPDCNVPTRALPGSPRWEWEQEHGKLITIITRELGDDGKFYYKVEKTTCPVDKSERKRYNCCSFAYKIGS